MSDATLDQVHAPPELLSSGAAAADARAVSSTVLVSEGFPTPSHLSFAAATPSRSGLQQLGTIALLLYVAQLLTGEPDLTIRQLASPDYEGAVAYIRAIIDNGDIRSEFPNIPADRYAALRLAADQQLGLSARSTVAPASPGGSSLLASDLAGAVRQDKRWAFNGTSCARLAGSGKVSVLFWLESLQSALRGELGILDGKLQGQYLRQLVEGPILDQLLRKIEELPDLQAAAANGTATFEDYAAALIACADPDDALACHYEANRPHRNAGEKLSDALAREELAFRAAAAHGCKPGEAGRFWAVFGLLSSAERSAFTGRPGVRGRMQRPLRESAAAAAARHVALLADLLSWAKVQSTTTTPAPPRPCPPRAADPPPAAHGSASRHRRRSSSATAAAALASGAGHPAPTSSSEEDEAAPAMAAPAATPVSPRGPRSPPVYHYTGDRARDATETARRRASGECLKCLPGGLINSNPCRLHPSVPQESSAPRCFPYRD